MKKLGKKAKKFVKKNLPALQKRQRKLKSKFKKKAASKEKRDVVEDQEGDNAKHSSRKNVGDALENLSLHAIFIDEDSNMLGDDSESDGYISEDLSYSNSNVAVNERKNHIEEEVGSSDLLVKNKEIHSTLAEKVKKLNRLKKKDPKFCAFLESYGKNFKVPALSNDEEVCSDEEGTSDDNLDPNKHGTSLFEGTMLTSSVIDSWHQLLKEKNDLPPLISLINGYRAACHNGTKATSSLDAAMCNRIQNSETFTNILMSMLHEADNIFRRLLGLSSTCKKETILELKNSSKWKTVGPLIKSYLRSTIYLLNQVSESEILAFSLAQIRSSIIFLVVFPSLQSRLIKITVHLWATGGKSISSLSFLILQDMASVLGSRCFDTCLIKMYKSFIGHCQLVDPVLYNHIQFLRDSLVKLCSLDMERSSSKASASIKHLAKILQLGLRTKEMEALRQICSWQYANCIDLWVKFIAANFHDNDLHSLLYMVIQIIKGMVFIFVGPRYLPLRIKCIQWLNHLSSSSGIFIPVSSIVLDILDYTVGKDGGKAGTAVNVSSTLKLPKYWLKSRNFQEECILSAMELLAFHFSQWSYHISFPELAIVPLIQLRKIHDTTSIDSFKRLIKRFIDQVELNVEFVGKKRDEVAFSPNDEQSVETFLQLEKQSASTPFSQYYKSIMNKAASRNLAVNGKIPESQKEGEKKLNRIQNGHHDADGSGEAEKRKKKQSLEGETDGSKRKRRKK